MKLRRNNRLRRKCAPKVAFNDRKPKLNNSPRKAKLNNSPRKAKLNNSPRKRKVKITVKRGKYTSNNITLKETALNNKILRIHLTKENLNSLKRKITKPNISKLKKDLNLNIKRTLTTQNTLYKVGKKPQFKVKLFPKTRKINSTKMVVSNGKIIKHETDILKRLKVKNCRVFYLKFANYKTAAEGKLSYKFHQLVNDVKNMQLPTPSWKIKVIIRHNKIAAIIFTNKSVLERSVSFNSDEDKYHIIIDNKPAILLGSPGKVDNCHDIEVLLSILEAIEKDSPMITYK